MAKITERGPSHTPGEEPEGWAVESGPVILPPSTDGGQTEDVDDSEQDDAEPKDDSIDGNSGSDGDSADSVSEVGIEG